MNDLIAIQGDKTISVSGHLLIFSVGHVTVPQDSFLAWLDESRIPTKYHPNRIRPIDAVKAALKNIGEYETRNQSGQRVVIFIRKKKRNHYGIAMEVYDEEENRLSYDEIGSVTLRPQDRHGNHWGISAPNLPITEKETREILVGFSGALESLVKLYETHYRPAHITHLIHRIIDAARPIKIRPTGGVYYVSRDYDDTVEDLKAVYTILRQAGKDTDRTTLMDIPVLAQDDIMDALGSYLEEQVYKDIALLQKRIDKIPDDGIPPSKYSELTEAFTDIQETYKAHVGHLSGYMGLTNSVFTEVSNNLVNAASKVRDKNSKNGA